MKIFLLGTLLLTCPVRAEDWPGLLGEFRSGHSQYMRPIEISSSGVLKPQWHVPAGQGYAGPAIADGQAVLFDRDGAGDRVRMVDAKNGKTIWEQKLPANYRGGIDADKGPRCVPTITDKSVVVYSAAGDLSALSRADGSIQWTRTLRKDTQADDGYFGAGSTPLVIGDRMVVNVGSKKAGIVCVSLGKRPTALVGHGL